MAIIIPYEDEDVQLKSEHNMDLMDTVITILCVIVAMGLLCCLCCLCMKLSDLKMKNYILELARQKGITLDPDKLSSKHKESPSARENCTIMIPDVGIVF